MIRHQKTTPTIIIQRTKAEFTDYRVLFCYPNALEVVEVTDTNDIGKYMVWVSSHRIFTKRIRQIFRSMVNQKSYCNMRTKWLNKNGYNTDNYEKLLRHLFSEQYCFSEEANKEWMLNVNVPMTEKIREIYVSKDKDNDDIPF